MVYRPIGLDHIRRNPKGDGPDDDHPNRGGGNGNTSNAPQTTTTVHSTVTTTISTFSSTIIVISQTTISPAAKAVDTHLLSSLGPGPTNSISQPATDFNVTSPLPSLSTFEFSQPGEATTCKSFTILWTYSGANAIPVTLSIEQSPSTQPVVSKTLATSVPSNAQIYIWGVVDVAEGSYVLNAIASDSTRGFLSRSPPFAIKNGTDTGCLQEITASSTQSHSSLSTPSGSSPSQPFDASHSLRVGDIVGITLGAVAGIIFLLAAFIFPRLWRRALPSPKKRRPYLLY